LLALQFVRTLVTPELEGTLIRAQPAVCRANIWPESVLRTIVKRDREGREIERRRRLFRISPEKNVLR